MTWGKLDDGFWRHRKVLRAARDDLEAVGLFAQAISYVSDFETDGRIEDYDFENLCPDQERRRRIVEFLIECKLLDRHQGRKASKANPANLVTAADAEWFDLEDGVFQIHDYLDFNRSKAKLDAEREDGTRRSREHRRHRYGGGKAQAA